MQSTDVIADKYRIERPVGRGGWGDVYLATHLELNKPVAIKLLSQHLLQRDAAWQRFTNEAKIISTLHHANIVSVFDFGELPSGQPYFVMDYIEGPSLSQIIKQGPLEYSKAIQFFINICDGLQHAHERGILHRDIKPANILIRTDASGNERAMLLDFGLAKLVSDEANASITKTGETSGTPQYMSPEQCTGTALDVRSDIYSLGCLMYETLTGVKPFTADNAVLLMEMHLNNRPESFSAHGANVPNEVEHVVLRTLEKHPNERYRNAADLKKALLEALTPTLQTAVLVRLQQSRNSIRRNWRSPRVVAGAASVVVILSALGAWQAWRHQTENALAYKWSGTDTTPQRGAFEGAQHDFIRSGQYASHFLANLPATASSINQLSETMDVAEVFIDLNRAKDAETACRWGARNCQHFGQQADRRRLEFQSVLAMALAFQGKDDEALSIGESACDQMKKLAGDSHTDYAACLHDLGRAYLRTGKNLEAYNTFEKAITILSQSAEETNEDMRRLRSDKARAAISLGRMSEAKQSLERLLMLPPLSVGYHSYLISLLGEMCERQGDDKAALDYYRQAIKVHSETPHADPQFADMLLRYAKLLAKNGYKDAAAITSRSALDIDRAMQRDPHPELL